MKRPTLVYLDDVLESIGCIREYVGDSDREAFLKDRQLQDAVIRRLEIIGEAVKHLPADQRKKHDSIAWSQIAGLRDVLIHAYFGVNPEQLWLVIRNELDDLESAIRKIKTELK